MGIFSDGLNSQIQSNKEKMNQYEADLEKYQQAVEDAKKAKDLFRQSASNMNKMILETDGVFQGSAATMFAGKLTIYNKSVKAMVSIMEKRIKAFEKRISEIEGQKKWCNVWTNIMSGLMSSLKFLGF